MCVLEFSLWPAVDTTMPAVYTVTLCLWSDLFPLSSFLAIKLTCVRPLRPHRQEDASQSPTPPTHSLSPPLHVTACLKPFHFCTTSHSKPPSHFGVIFHLPFPDLLDPSSPMAREQGLVKAGQAGDQGAMPPPRQRTVDCGPGWRLSCAGPFGRGLVDAWERRILIHI